MGIAEEADDLIVLKYLILFNPCGDLAGARSALA